MIRQTAARAIAVAGALLATTIDTPAAGEPDAMASPATSVYSLAHTTHMLERLVSNAASHAGALDVQDAGVTGRGVRVNVIDTGIRATHVEFSGGRVLATESRDLTVSGPAAGTGVTDGNGHGTFVSSIIGAAANAQGFVGVAPDASVISSQVMSSATGWSASGATLLLGVRNGLAAGAFIHNMSLSGSGPVGETALREAVAAGTLSVVAAGNRGLANPDWPARYARESWANGAIIAVGAVDEGNRIAWFSNRAGDTANWYLVALGVDVVGASNTGDSALRTATGTSMAAPVVAGVAALVKSRWPNLTATQVGRILLETATDLGAPGVDPVYGHGLVDARRAMEPVGTTVAPTTAGTWVVSSQANVLATTATWGAGVSARAATGALDPVVFDTFGRDFVQDVSKTVASPRPLAFERAAAFSDRHMRFAERTLDPLGSRLLVAGEYRSDLARADGFEWSSLANYAHRFRAAGALLGMAWVQKFPDGAAFGLSAGGLNAFFGLQGMDTVSTQFHANGLQSPLLGLVPLAQTVGLAWPVGRSWTVKFGAATSLGSNAVSEQLGISGGLALRQTMTLVELNRTFDDGRTVVGVQAGSLDERESLWGGQGYGLLSLQGTGASTQSITLQAASRIAEGWAIGAQWSVARSPATTNGTGSLIAGTTATRLTAWGVGVTRFDAFADGDRIAVTASEPLAVRTGAMLFDIPIGTDPGAPAFRRETVPLAGAARERLYEATWTVPVATSRAAFSVSAMLRSRPLGNADAPAEWLGVVRYSRAF